MAWRSLKDRLNDVRVNMPLVLAGPLLRKVTPKTVTVWLALRKPGQVTLRVQDAGGSQIMEGKRHTVAVGVNLHLVAVTATTPTPAAELTEGILYRYDLAFTLDDNTSHTLANATANAPLAYPPLDKPTFCMPPKDLNKLRLIHGSCRIPHGHGWDAFQILDDVIAQNATDPLARPHQLLLMGDQIYADDVAASLLLMLSDAADALLGWKEVLPVASDHGGDVTPERLPPYLRQDILKDAGFTSTDLDAHLMSLGEYLCMYLFVWSDMLWDGDALPTFLDVLSAGRARISDPIAFGHWLGERVRHKDEESVKKQAANLKLFRESLLQVRRALANIPSYMIFDDHEVTDDWNMTLDITLKMHGTPLGQRIIQNAVVAYALCQHWGNAPEQFTDSSPTPPGLALLRLLDKGTAATYTQNGPTLRSLVGVPDAAEIKAKQAVFHRENALTYNYTVEGPAHQILFTDTRTWRTFPYGSNKGGEFLTADQFTQQIAQTPPTGDRALLVVLSTNAPPVEPIRSATRHPIFTRFFAHVPDIYEAWELPSVAFDRLIKTLTDKLPLVAGERRGSVLLLSGDVHFSFASRMLYKATTRLGDEQPQPATAVIAQLVASSFRKQTDKTLGFQREGYRYAPYWFVRWLIPEHKPEGYLGWNALLDSERPVGQAGKGVSGAWVPLWTLTLDQPTMAVSPDRLALGVKGLFFDVGIFSDSAPDYSYRLDYLLPTAPDTVDRPTLPPLPAGATPVQRQQAAAAFLQAMQSYLFYNAGGAMSKIIGTNNLAQITFAWDAADPKKRKIHHTVRWRKDANSAVQVTDYVVSLDPDDPKYPVIQPRAVSPAIHG